MLKLVLLGLISACLAVTVLEGREIRLENGKSLYLQTVDSKDLKYVESQLGCSTKCASACLKFSTGYAAYQCSAHCGCSSLISAKLETEAKNLYESSDSELILPLSDPQTTKIRAETHEEDSSIAVSSINNSQEEFKQESLKTMTDLPNIEKITSEESFESLNFINDSQSVQYSSGNFGIVEWRFVLFACITLAFLAYKKYSSIKARKYRLSVRPEDSTGYIRL